MSVVVSITHANNHKSKKSFIYILKLKDDENLLAAIDKIANCMNTQCCSDAVPAIPGLDTCIGK